MVTRTTAPDGESMDDLRGEALQLEGDGAGGGDPPPGAGPEPAPPPKPTNAQMLAVAIQLGRDVFCDYTKFNSPRVTLADDNVVVLGDTWGAVLDKHNIDLNAYLGNFAVEMAAIMATLKIGAAVRMGVLHEMAQRDAEMKREKEAADKRTIDVPPNGGIQD
jgi:hypothetical protein